MRRTSKEIVVKDQMKKIVIDRIVHHKRMLLDDPYTKENFQHQQKLISIISELDDLTKMFEASFKNPT